MGKQIHEEHSHTRMQFRILYEKPLTVTMGSQFLSSYNCNTSSYIAIERIVEHEILLNRFDKSKLLSLWFVVIKILETPNFHNKFINY